MKPKLKINGTEIEGVRDVTWSNYAPIDAPKWPAMREMFHAAITTLLSREEADRLLSALEGKPLSLPEWLLVEAVWEGIDVQEAFRRAREIHEHSGAKRAGYGCAVARSYAGQYAVTVACIEAPPPSAYPQGWTPLGWLPPAN